VVLKLGQLGKWSRYTGKVLKCGAETGRVGKVEQIYRESSEMWAGEGWSRSVGPIV
jgi:hypothetical protein